MKKSTKRFLSWSASRLDDYEKCPLQAKLKHLDKLCTLCFKGRVMGGYDSPAVCDTCHQENVKPAAWERGSEIGKNLELYVKGQANKVHKEIKHPFILKEAKRLRDLFKKGASVQVERVINFGRDWKVLPAKWSKEIWLIVKFDVIERLSSILYVLDWKTGGVKNGEIRASDKYDDQLGIYNVTALVAHPDTIKVESSLGFVDCDSSVEPFVRRPGLFRKDLTSAKKYWEKRSLPIFKDDVFAPKASANACYFCPYKKALGGPCPY